MEASCAQCCEIGSVFLLWHRSHFTCPFPTHQELKEPAVSYVKLLLVFSQLLVADLSAWMANSFREPLHAWCLLCLLWKRDVWAEKEIKWVTTTTESITNWMNQQTLCFQLFTFTNQIFRVEFFLLSSHQVLKHTQYRANTDFHLVCKSSKMNILAQLTLVMVLWFQTFKHPFRAPGPCSWY